MKNILFTVFLFIGITTVKGQYATAIGVKVNHYKLAANVKHFVSETNALDLELGFQETGVEFIGLYNWQVPVTNVEGLYWYYGLGFNLGCWSDPAFRTVSFGVDGQVGMEYVPAEIPIVFSIDYIPNFSIQDIYNKGINDHTKASGFWKENWTIGIKFKITSKSTQDSSEELN